MEISEYRNMNYNNTICIFWEGVGKRDVSSYIRTHRLLAKYEKPYELKYSKLQNKVPDNEYNYKAVNLKNNKNTYKNLKPSRSNNVESYLKGYKSRYAKKKGLKKFDCYFEKNFFNSINEIEKMVEKNDISSYRITQTLYKKFGLQFFIITLLPLLALAIPTMEITKTYRLKFPSYIKVMNGKKNLTEKVFTRRIITDSTANWIFLCILMITMLLLFIYLYIKILKYKRIRSGMLK
ncbi:hypothetical protein PVBG_06003 [Plasmodium vivax Brazil I]|uniref:Variable surface protein Vir35 n=1 Tax=Plasmodium vivax (strain Brazil I) TaxID=1033975 RepID=A0A0J9T1P8_PLAV1|nr:hypothetical protein PVBG_06003 [Plasmodium vivax Brazil I]